MTGLNEIKDGSGAVKLTGRDYKSELKPIWCAGCGNFGLLNGLAQAFADLAIPRHEIAVITGIGCSSRLPGYLSTYGFNSLHGRAVPIATGAKLASPGTTVIAAGGDGDMFSIGGGHLPHAARRNVDMTLLAIDNRVYGLTKGQMSPTTPLDSLTPTTRYGSYDPPVNMITFMLAYKAGFVARAYSGNMKQLTEIIKEAILYKGFAFIQVLSPCITYRGKEEFSTIKALARDLPDDHDPTDWKAAVSIAEDPEWLYCGVIYRNSNLLTYEERITSVQAKACEVCSKPLSELIGEFRP
jgi:2-oxoglutarate ferredoxin oxidoreductase subunit beta